MGKLNFTSMIMAKAKLGVHKEEETPEQENERNRTLEEAATS